MSNRYYYTSGKWAADGERVANALSRPPPNPLTRTDYGLLLTSLGYTREAFEKYNYQSEELRREQLASVDQLVRKLRTMARGGEADEG